MIVKKKLLIIIIAIILTIICSAVFLFFIPGKSLYVPVKSPTILLNHSPRVSDLTPYIQDGDIILRMTAGHWSKSFREYSPIDKRFSHCGIIRIRDDKITIINAMGSASNANLGVEEVALDRFVKVASAVGIYRVRGADGSTISDTAIQYLDRPFDFTFDLEDDTTVYCTELVYLALKPVKPEHFLSTIYSNDVKKDIIPIDSISNNPAIDELVYIVNQNEQAVDQENRAMLKRYNPVKIKFIQKMVIFFGKIRKAPQI